MLKNTTKIIVIGSEKHKVGKTLISAHCICYLLYKGYSVASIDLDSTQQTLTKYVGNRVNHVQDKKINIPISQHFLIKESNNQNKQHKHLQEGKAFQNVIESLLNKVNYVVVDTEDFRSYISKQAYSYANVLITLIGESFEDIDSIAKYQPTNDENKLSNFYQPSQYTQLIWETKMHQIKKKNQKIDWVIARNRLSNNYQHNSANNAKLMDILDMLSKKFGFKLLSGCKEMPILNTFFSEGLTILDLKSNFFKKTSIADIVARQEFKHFMTKILY